MLNASIIGNLGSDAELRYSASGSPLLNANVACNARVRDKDGQWVDETTWVRVTVFGQRAETLHAHLVKGTKVYASGRLQARPWTDRSGNLKAGLELVADSLEFFSSRQDSGQQRPDDDGLAF